MKLTCDQIENFLPNPPDNYSYEVSQVSPLVHRIDLLHHVVYDYNLGQPVRTVYGFVKGSKVYPPKNYKTPRPKPVCNLTEMYLQSGYTTIIPTTRSLLHLK